MYFEEIVIIRSRPSDVNKMLNMCISESQKRYTIILFIFTSIKKVHRMKNTEKLVSYSIQLNNNIDFEKSAECKSKYQEMYTELLEYLKFYCIDLYNLRKRRYLE